MRFRGWHRIGVRFLPGPNIRIHARCLRTVQSLDLVFRPDGHDSIGMEYKGLITIEPGKRGGKPCIRGLRITVYDVLDYLAGGMSEDQIVEDFPDLTIEDIRACLAFAADRERRLHVAAG